MTLPFRILFFASLPLIAIALVVGRLRRRPLGEDIIRLLPLVSLMVMSLDDTFPVSAEVGRAAHVIGVLLFLPYVVYLVRELRKMWNEKPGA